MEFTRTGVIGDAIGSGLRDSVACGSTWAINEDPAVFRLIGSCRHLLLAVIATIVPGLLLTEDVLHRRHAPLMLNDVRQLMRKKSASTLSIRGKLSHAESDRIPHGKSARLHGSSKFSSG
jgi:hypothetical protein